MKEDRENITERTLVTENFQSEGLSLFFTILCVVDLFGVFPIVALPKAIIDCGAFGIPIVVCVFCVQIYAAILLGRCWNIAEEIKPSIREKNRYPYAAVAELTYGPVMRTFVTILLDATVFGGGIPNLLVASQNLQLFGTKVSAYEFNFSFCWWLVIIGFLLCPIMWLGSPKDMKSLSILSALLVSSVTIITCYCIVSDNTSNTRIAPQTIPTMQEILIAYGIIAFQFDIHPMLMTIQVDMKDGTKIGSAVVGGFSVTAIMFSLTTGLATYRYGSHIEPNILQGLPGTLPLYFIVLLVTFQLCLSSAVGSSALFQHIEDKLKIPRVFSSRRCLIRSLVVAFGVLLGEIVPRFDLVMSLIGSTLTGPLMFILPPLFYSKLLKMRNQTKCHLLNGNTCNINKMQTGAQDESKAETIPLIHNQAIPILNTKDRIETILSLIIVIFGVSITLISTFYNWSNVIRYARFTPSCLWNITSNSLLYGI